jgi:cytochrome c biogenesis protein CcdA
MRLNKARVLLIFLLLFLLIQKSYSTEQVVIEFLYYDPSTKPGYSETCKPCYDAYLEFLSKQDVVNEIEDYYGSLVSVNRTDILSSEGQDKKHAYAILEFNSLVIKDSEGNFTVIEGGFNETYIKQVIDAYLGGESPPPKPFSLSPLAALLLTSFSVGFLESFSPCLIALLSFVLSYTISNTTKFREGLLQVLTFGAGFIFAAALLGLTVGLMFISVPWLHDTIMWIVVIFAIFFGLDLLGLNILQLLNIKFDTKPLITKLSRKYVFTYAGLILLGFVFYFLDPCIAPIFVPMLNILLPEYFSLTFFVFCIGALVPFIIFGVIAGSMSKLARSTYRHRSKIRAVSGLILIAYAIYLIIVYLIS